MPFEVFGQLEPRFPEETLEEYEQRRNQYYRTLNVWWKYKIAHCRAVIKFRGLLRKNPDLVERIRSDLRGKNLVCHCHPELRCHGYVLLAFANTTCPFELVPF